MKMHIGCFGAFISMFYIVGFAILGYGLWAAIRSKQSASWPTTPGTIKDLQLTEKTDSDGSTYEVTIQYAYKVDGKDFEGKLIAFGYSASNVRKSHEEILQKLKQAKSVDVRYRPTDPQDSCLSYGLNRSIQFLLVFAVTWLAFIFGFTLLFCMGVSSDTVLLDNMSVN